MRDPGDLAAYEELRAGFTASVSHELRTPLARLLALLERATLPDADHDDLIEQAQAEVRQIGELIDDVLFLSELESGRELVALGSTVALPILEEVVESLGEHAARAGLTLRTEGDPEAELPASAADDPRDRGRTSPRTPSATPGPARRSRSRFALAS